MSLNNINNKQQAEPQILQQEPQTPQEPQILQQEPQTLQEPVSQMPNAYESTINQQNSMIEALIAQNEKLTQQITQMINGGLQIQQPQQIPGQMQMNIPSIPPSVSQLADEDYSLESLAKEIGKHSR